MKQAAFFSLCILPFSLTSGSFNTVTVQASQNTDKLIQGQIPVQSLYQLLAAEMALDRHLPDIALANYIAAAQETQDPNVAAKATQIALRLAGLDIALEPALIWAHADPKNLEAQITTAALYIRLNQVPQAIPYLVQAEKANKEQALPYFLVLFEQLQDEADREGVIQALQTLVKQNSPTAHLALAEIYLSLEKGTCALPLAAYAFEREPHSLTAIQLYHESLLAVEGTSAAKRFLQRTYQLAPNTLLAQYYLQFLLSYGFVQDAHQLMKAQLKTTLSNEALLAFAQTCLQAQQFDLAQMALQKASQSSEGQDNAYYFLARLAELQNQIPLAIERYQQVLTGSFHVTAQIRASTLLAQQKHYTQAFTVLARTQWQDSQDKKQLLLANIALLNQTKQYQKALSLLNEALETMPLESELYYARSLIAAHLDKVALAEQDLKTILAQAPQDLGALNALGFILADKTQRFTEAQQYLNQALSLAPDNPAVLDSMGWLYYKMGDYQRSLATLQKALDLQSDPEIAAHLEEVKWQLKSFSEAKKDSNITPID